MIEKKHLEKLEDYLWQISEDYRADMRVPAWVYATEDMLGQLLSDRSLNQLVNVATLPGIQKSAQVMPDAHEGYGFPIGGVCATRWPDGVISPGGIGYDINCGVRLLRSELSHKDARPHLKRLAGALYDKVPTGTGKSGPVKIGENEMDRMMTEGASWAVKAGYGEEGDIENIESKGKLDGADPGKVSSKAVKRGNDQLGTLGGGNHFLEVDYVDRIVDREAGRAFGLEEGQLVVMIHTGSRGFGHQIATDYLRLFMQAMPNYDIHPPDKELACAPFNSEEGKAYYKAMQAAANFAFNNRQVITWEVRQVWQQIFGSYGGPLSLLYDVAHNIAKVEKHVIDGEKLDVIVHRKGATRSFGPGYSELPDAYSEVGQPVLIPGSMGTASYVLAGNNRSMELSFGSCCHGAGRRMSRRQAKKQVEAGHLTRSLEHEGIHVRAASSSGVAEEAPLAYKEVDEVVKTVEMAGLARRVARLRPMVVIKG